MKSIDKDNLIVALQEFKEINDGMYTSKEELNDLTVKVDSINIAQKTVNTRGTKELLGSQIMFNINPATTDGTPVNTVLNQTIDLIDSIEDYNFLQFELKINTVTRVVRSNSKFINMPVVYNNTNIVNLEDDSFLAISLDISTSYVNSYGLAHFVLVGWFKNSTQFHVYSIYNPIKPADYNRISISSIKAIKIENVTIDPVNYINTNKGIEDTPVGHILFFMGKTAPKHYLACDGSIYNIADYPYLAQSYKEQFGTENFFGGDGITTFAVQDLRGEFLRGTGENSITGIKGGEVGIHQEGTNHVHAYSYGNGSNQYLQLRNKNHNEAIYPDYVDKYTKPGSTHWRNYSRSGNGTDAGGYGAYKSRPDNTAALLCVKYEPTYFMNIQGMIEETVLWEGKIGSNSANPVSNSITLSNSLLDYDEIQFCLIYDTGFDAAIYHETITPNDFNQLINYTYANTFISYISSGGSSSGYANILKTSTAKILQWTFFKYYITKIVGIKYKTFQNDGGNSGGGNCECETYTDEEVNEMLERAWEE